MLNFYTEFPSSPMLTQIPYVPFIPKLLYTSLSEQDHKDFPWRDKYSKYWENALDSIVNLVQLADADIVVLPYDWYWYRGPHWLPKIPKLVAKAVKEANMNVYQQALLVGKPVILFFSGDRSHEPTPFSKAITFRENVYISRKGLRDYCMPAFSEDIAYQVTGTVQGQKSGSLILRKKNSTPTIGFCGLAPIPDFADRFLDLAYYLCTFLSHRYFDISPHYGERLRYQVIKMLNASDKINTNFIVRDKSIFLGKPDSFQKRKSRQEFIHNMIDSDYILCCRGSGNYSFRIYEALCMGRIPVIIAPDSLLPYTSHISWKDYCIFVEDTDLKSVSEQVYKHYDSLSSSAYHEQQLACRRIWEDYLSPQGFFDHLSLHFDNELFQIKL